MKSTWIPTETGPVHVDLADDATPEDVEAISQYVKAIRAKQAQIERDFEQLWEGEWQKLGKSFKDVAFLWFKVGYELAEIRENPANELATLRAENERYKTNNAALVTDFTNLSNTLREWAGGHYCQTYNKGMGDGLEAAALAIEETLEEYRGSTQDN